MARDNRTMSRKDFIKKSSAALVGVGLAARRPEAGLAAVPEAGSFSLRPLGRTGIKVSPIGFGASRTMEPGLVRAALEGGVNFLDTGRSYFNGRNEEMLGEVISGMRRELVIQSKLRLRVSSEDAEDLTSEETGIMTRAMTESLETSLRALRTDTIDIMLIHGAVSPALVHHESVKDFFMAAKKAGKIRAHGFSSHENQLALARAAVEENFFDVIMIPYNHKGSYIHSNSGRYSEWDQPALDIVLERAGTAGIGIVAMKTCSGGPFSPEKGGEPTFEHALRWILRGNRIDSLAVAMANFEQIEENLRALS